MYELFNESTTSAMNAIITNGSLIKKVYVPKYLFPVSKVFSTLINLGASVIVLLAVMLVTKVPLNGNVIWILVPLSGLIFLVWDWDWCFPPWLYSFGICCIFTE